MTVTRVDIVRHGATQVTSEDRFSGTVGVELEDLIGQEGVIKNAWVSVEKGIVHEKDRGSVD